MAAFHQVNTPGGHLAPQLGDGGLPRGHPGDRLGRGDPASMTPLSRASRSALTARRRAQLGWALPERRAPEWPKPPPHTCQLPMGRAAAAPSSMVSATRL